MLLDDGHVGKRLRLAWDLVVLSTFNAILAATQVAHACRASSDNPVSVHV